MLASCNTVVTGGFETQACGDARGCSRLLTAAESRPMPVSAQRECPPLPSNSEPSGNLARSCPPVFNQVSDFVVYFQRGSHRGHKWWISLVGRRDERALWWGGEKERSIPPFPFIVPYEWARVRRVTSTKELYIADKWRGSLRFFLIFPLSKVAWAPQGTSATAAAADPLERTQVMEIEYVGRGMSDECAPEDKTGTAQCLQHLKTTHGIVRRNRSAADLHHLPVSLNM